MCGIFFSIGVGRSSALEAFDKLKHRGPDSTISIFDDNNCTFIGFHRLAIQDLKLSASQPFWSKSRNSLVLFNGEIYNTKILIERYLKNESLTTKSDTEVVVELIEKIGLKETISSLEGMFAIVYMNMTSGETTFIRDYFGSKRLYWTRYLDSFIASSEIPPLLDINGSHSVNEKAVLSWLNHDLIDFSEQTFFRDIFELPPGHILTRNHMGEVHLEDWRTSCQRLSHNDEVDMHNLEKLIDECIQQAMIGESSRGVLLSGGIDSSLLFNVSRKIDPSVVALSVDWTDSDYSERRFIHSLSKPSTHYCVDGFSIDFSTRLEASLTHYAQPFGSPFVLCLEDLFELAQQKGIRILLDGNGLDELFFGYDKYRINRKNKNQTISQDGTLGVRRNIIARDFLSGSSIQSQALQELGSQRDFDLFHGKIPRALRYSDQASMKFGRELRVPFLNRSLFDFANSMPEVSMYDAELGKMPIRKILENKIGPNPYIYAKKRSLQTPVREWFQTSWRPWVLNEIRESPLIDLGWINYQAFVSEYDAYQQSFDIKTSNSLFLWQWLSLAIWSRLFVK